MSVASSRPRTRGVVQIHSAPTALCPHIVWAVEGVVGRRVDARWESQPVGRRALRTEIRWSGEPGTGAALASALRTFGQVRFEVTEEATDLSEGSRWSHTPELGIHHNHTSSAGDIVVDENRLRAALDAHRHDAAALSAAIEDMLGERWDAELDVFRHAGEDSTVRWIERAG